MLIKSALVGLVAATLGLVVWTVAKLILLVIPLATQTSSGIGGLGAVGVDLSSTDGLIVAGVCFFVGSTWMYGRVRRRGAN